MLYDIYDDFSIPSFSNLDIKYFRLSFQLSNNSSETLPSILFSFSSFYFRCQIISQPLILQADETSLATFFSTYGKVVECKIIMDKVTGKSKGYGFVTFETAESANKVKNSQNLYFLGKMVKQITPSI